MFLLTHDISTMTNQELEQCKRFEEYTSTLRLSNKELSKMIGISESYVSAILNHKRPLSRAVINKAAQAFPDLSPDWLLNGVGVGQMAKESRIGYGDKLPVQFEEFYISILTRMAAIEKDNEQIKATLKKNKLM